MKQSDFEFKRTFFGGFDRKDVSRYIAMLAADRNGLSAKCDELSEQLNALQEENRELHQKLESTCEALTTSEESRELKSAEFAEKAENALSEFRASCNTTIASLRESAQAVICEVEGLESLFSALTEAADTVETRINEICLKNGTDSKPDDSEEAE